MNPDERADLVTRHTEEVVIAEEEIGRAHV